MRQGYQPPLSTPQFFVEEMNMLRTVRALLIAILAFGGLLPVCSIAEEDQTIGALFVMTNAADKNEIVAYKRAHDGSLSDEHRFATGGRGSGGTTDPLASQGSLTLTADHSFLLAVNAGSGEISSFRVHGAQLELADIVPSGGSKPVSVAQHGNLVYVVNAGGDSDVAGFRLAGNGKLAQIPHSTTRLSTSNLGPGSVAFSPDGQFLVVTEKATNNIDVFRLQSNGRLGPIVVNPSAGAGVFALLFAPNGAALASETGPPSGAISSYAVQSNGALSTISASVPTLGAATCWQAVTPDGRFVYTANSGSSTISGFSIGKNGGLTPLSGTVVATLPTGSIDLDTTITADGKFLYTLNSGTGTIGIFGIDADGTLSSLGEKGGLPASAGFNGIAAF
jgi:6-phosphogluconolactonase (cycloisomerase 2 family)